MDLRLAFNGAQAAKDREMRERLGLQDKLVHTLQSQLASIVR